MMKFNTALVIGSLVVTSSALGAAIAYAQTESQTFPPSSQTRSSYVSTLNTYRKDEEAFSVARQEYFQLQTLGKLEVAVNAFRSAQLSRVNTTITYYEALLSMVSEAKGMEVSKKEALLQKLQTAIAEHKQLMDEIKGAQDRVELEATAVKFTDMKDSVVSLEFESLSLLRITAMQSALDQMQVTIDLVQKQSEHLAEAQKAEKQRGFDELSRRIETIRSTIKKANDVHDRLAGDDNYSDSGYAQLTDTLNVSYPELRQAENFLRELAGK